MATELQHVEFQVPGLCCLECSEGVETALRQTPGVQDLRVLGVAEKVFVTYDVAMTQPEKLAQVVTDAGHLVTFWNVEGADTSSRSFTEASNSPKPQSR